MKQRFERGAGVLLTTSALLTGCATSAINHEPPTILHLESLPPTLPLPVSQQLPNVAGILGLRFLGKDPKPHGIKDCTGVRIDPINVLSAGSCDFDLSAIDQIQGCDRVRVSLPGASFFVSRKSGTKPSPDGTASEMLAPDSLLAEIAPNKKQPLPAYANPTHFATAAGPMSLGTPLYMASFQLTMNGEFRSPDPGSLSPESQKKKLNEPLVLGALALDEYSNNGAIEMLVVGKSYGDPKETVERAGDYGGPVWDGNGNLVGIVTNNNDAHTLNEYEHSRLNFDVPGIPANAMAHIAVVQRVNQTNINQLLPQQKPEQTCEK